MAKVMFECLECGKVFGVVKRLPERCPKCKGVDLEVK